MSLLAPKKSNIFVKNYIKQSSKQWKFKIYENGLLSTMKCIVMREISIFQILLIYWISTCYRVVPLCFRSLKQHHHLPPIVTSIKAVVAPKTLSAIHTYVPPSWYVTNSTSNSFLLIAVLTKSWSFNHVIFGVGEPVTWHSNLMWDFNGTISFPLPLDTAFVLPVSLDRKCGNMAAVGFSTMILFKLLLLVLIPVSLNVYFKNKSLKLITFKKFQNTQRKKMAKIFMSINIREIAGKYRKKLS